MIHFYHCAMIHFYHCAISLLLLSHFCIAQDLSITWEFYNGLEGWGQATSNEMNADISHMGDELWINIHGPGKPYIDSPKMNIMINEEQTVALRYRYIGRSKFGKLGLQGIVENVDIGDDDDLAHIHFALENDGNWHIGYIPLKSDDDGNKLSIDKIYQMRLWPGCRRVSSKKWKQSDSPRSGDAFQIDWIRLVRAPIINRVSGCTGTKTEIGNSVLYKSTFNCLREGREKIMIEGHNFGEGGIDKSGAPAHVFIAGLPCTFVEHDPNAPQERLTCVTPPMPLEYQDSGNFQYGYRPSSVEVKNGKLPGLVGWSTQLTYAANPSTPTNLSLSNFASRSIDLSWTPGGETWQRTTYTGYILKWRDTSSPSWTHSSVVGNITTTTVRGLSSNTSYIFGVAGLNENQNNASWWDSLDQYGRRDILANSLEGRMAEIQGRTIMYDLDFQKFDANSTQYHGELHAGLVLVGRTNVANCNASSFCCDQFDDESGQCLGEETMTCFSPGPSFDPLQDSDRMIIANLSSYSPTDSKLFKVQCGPSLRLTPSEARVRGAAFYSRQLEVSEGFETNFTIEISNPSFRCNNMDKIHTHCRSRGGDGFAFVIQSDRADAIGNPGLGLGYDGINNSIAVEFDTYHNFETHDPYENHISVHTRGWHEPNDSNHTFSLGHTNSIPSLTDGKLNIRITYTPITNEDIFTRKGFVASPHTLLFFQRDWSNGAGLGVLTVYCCEDVNTPVLSVPLNLRKTLDLSDNAGRAWVGFTAATGLETFQAHDVLSWQYSSLRLDDL